MPSFADTSHGFSASRDRSPAPQGPKLARRYELPDLWLKAAVLGSLWASNEIIVGSFLHNLRVPFAGVLLAAMGVAILVSGHQVWPEKGLFWRSALLCAVMKSISPSAIILGPMIGVFMEGILLEGITRLLGANRLGYALAGGGAVSWALMQKAGAYLITYGSPIVELYTKLYEYAAGRIGVVGVGPFDALGLLFGVHLLLGATAASVAVSAGRKARDMAADWKPESHEQRSKMDFFEVDPLQRYSLALLGLAFVGVVAGLLLLSYAPLVPAALFAAAYILLAVTRYRRSLGRLRRLRLWVELALIMMLSGLLLGGLGNRGGVWNWDGLLIGLEMTIRACLLVVGFAAISVELRNPRIIGWFTRRGMNGFSSALSVAFQALPEMTAALVGRRSLARHPLALLSGLLSHAVLWLRHYDRRRVRPFVVILTGAPGSGKTTLAAETAHRLRARGLRVGGVLAPGEWLDGRRAGFDAVDLLDGKRIPLCRRAEKASAAPGTGFRFEAEGLHLGRRALALERLREADVVILDEIGPLELRGGGWADALDALAGEWRGPMLWVVRENLVPEVTGRWLGGPAPVREAAEVEASSLAEELIAGAQTGDVTAGSDPDTNSLPAR